MQCFYKIGDSLVTLKRALEAKEIARQQLRDQLDEVEKETRSKLQEIDIFNNQLKVTVLCVSACMSYPLFFLTVQMISCYFIPGRKIYYAIVKAFTFIDEHYTI